MDAGNHHPPHPFPLRRVIEKLDSQSAHLDNLFEFANSPRLRPALLYNLTVTNLPSQSCSVSLPTSSGKWESILRAENMLDSDKRSEAGQKLSLIGKKNCPIHCECKLVQFFSPPHGPEWVPPFSYIGVSKLSCGACRIWMEAYNELGGQQFYTKGSHGAWYWPWGMPTMEASLNEAVVEKNP